MIAYEVTIKGFDGRTSDTDDLVKWVHAHDRVSLDAFLTRHGLTPDRLDEITELHPAYRKMHHIDGIDVILDEQGDVVSKSENCDPSQWVKLVRETK